MKEYEVSDLTSFLGALEKACRDLSTSDKLSQPICTDDFLSNLGRVLDALRILCTRFDADPSLINQITVLSTSAVELRCDRREAVLHAQIEAVLSGISTNLDERKFLFMPADEAAYYGKLGVFGDSFTKNYSVNAARDALEAANCYATNRYTACVFHCMRVAEYGLRKLAANRNLRIKLTKNRRPCPIEYGTWQDVITAIQNKIKKIRQRPVGPKREAELQFLSNAADHCDYMKELWRNELSHTRRWYKKEEALSAINRVKEFVMAVAEHRGSPQETDTMQRFIDAAVDESRKQQPIDQYSNLAMLAKLIPPLKANP
jgi:hypothetical protein